MCIMKNSNISYTRRSLALLYFPSLKPEQAVRKLSRWIRLCKPLYRELTRDGKAFDRRQFLTVREANIIMEYLGEP